MEVFLPDSTPANFVLSYCAGYCQTALLCLSEEQHPVGGCAAAHSLLSPLANLSVYRD